MNKCKNIEYISKFQSRGIKIDRVNLIRVAKPYFFQYLTCRCLQSDVIIGYRFLCVEIGSYLDTWILGVVSKQLKLLHGRVGDSTTSVNSLSPQISELVDDSVASWCGDIVGHFWLIRNDLSLVDIKWLCHLRVRE